MQNIKINPWWVVAAAALILVCNMGIRQSTGLMLPAISLDLSIPMATLGFGFGVQNLIWGAVSPIAGMMAERFGTPRVLLAGGVIYAAGLLLAAQAESSAMFFAGNAILIGVGVGATTYPIVLAAVGRHFGDRNRTLALGIASAGGSLGQFVYAMLHGWLAPLVEWSQIYTVYAASSLLILLLAGVLRERRDDAAVPGQPGSGLSWQAIREAFGNRDYQLLNIGFFVCGVHIAFLSVHLAGFVASCGLPVAVASDSLALIGLVNVVGVIGVGWAGDRWHKPWLLTLIYWLRACLIMMLLLLPPSSTLFYIFSVLMGMLWLSTVPLTSGTVAQIFGGRNLASLFGFVMFSHQVGAFLGSWWGGLVFQWYGNYDLALILSAALGLLAAAVHLPMTPARMRRYSEAAA
ncbi:MFS transporter [Marinobacterium jannaschii]|uniref:MFS transporter n=1 Tax=Marinobacterium jannaschii TaxID=64970 RepID=UPI0004873BA4|nr:MFS transporter [Marinobacterium jannaschii]